MKKILWLIFLIYVVVVLRLTVFRAYTMDAGELNFSLFSQLIEVYHTDGIWEFLRLFLGNIGWFVPFGFLLPFLWNKAKLWKVSLLGGLFSFGIEVAQYLLRKGYTELDDLLLNIFGCMVGYAMYLVANRWISAKKQ